MLKRIISSALLTSAFCTVQLLAQGSYTPTVHEEEYAPLAEGTQVNNEPWPEWHTYSSLPIGFEFPLFNKRFTTLNLEVSSRLVFDAGHHYFFDPLAMVTLKDVGEKGNTAISYHSSGAAGQRVFTVEFKDVRLKSDTSLFANFQTKLYENNGVLEFHMGPHNIPAGGTHLTLGPYSGIYHVKSVDQPIDFQEGINLMGDPQNPEVKEFSGAGLPYLTYTLNAVPMEGTVYRYTPNSNTSVAKASNTDVSWKYDATLKRLSIASFSNSELRLFNAGGQLCYSGSANKNIDLSHLPAGVYLAQCGYSTFKILI